LLLLALLHLLAHLLHPLAAHPLARALDLLLFLLDFLHPLHLRVGEHRAELLLRLLLHLAGLFHDLLALLLVLPGLLHLLAQLLHLLHLLLDDRAQVRELLVGQVKLRAELLEALLHAVALLLLLLLVSTLRRGGLLPVERVVAFHLPLVEHLGEPALGLLLHRLHLALHFALHGLPCGAVGGAFHALAVLLHDRLAALILVVENGLHLRALLVGQVELEGHQVEAHRLHVGLLLLLHATGPGRRGGLRLRAEGRRERQHHAGGQGDADTGNGRAENSHVEKTGKGKKKSRDECG
jgi:hypothetical protein